MSRTTFDTHKEYWASKSGIPSVFLEWMPNISGLQILDLGCGGGRLASSLTDAASVFGIDYSEELLKKAKQENPTLNLICGDFQSKKVWEQIPNLHLIISNCALRKDYCPNISKVTQLCFDKLLPGGILLLRIEAISDLSEVLPKSVRETLFFSKNELLESFSMFKTNIKEESFKQKFSSIAYMEKFLERIQIKSVKVNNLNPTRRYYILRAEKSIQQHR